MKVVRTFVEILIVVLLIASMAIVLATFVTGGIISIVQSVGREHYAIHPMFIVGCVGLVMLMFVLHRATTKPIG